MIFEQGRPHRLCIFMNELVSSFIPGIDFHSSYVYSSPSLLLYFFDYSSSLRTANASDA